MPLPFNKTLDLKLLELVKDNPILYNTKHSKYLDFDSREVVWQKIGDALSRPAAEFAGIQCQIQFGDYQEDKHKPGFIENLSEFLPMNYTGCWGIEKKVYKAHRKYTGLQPLEAKNTYIKTARELPTYGVTFFLVKEKQPGKMRLVPRLLGINAEAILRLDENSKEILQQWPLTHVKTYHVGKSDTFTLKFGDWSDKEYSCKTQDVLRIRDILVGYIDLIQRRMFAKPQVDPSESMTIYQDNIQSGQSHTMQLVSQQSTKLVQETFVGPTKLVPFEQGSTPHQGTQMMTVHQIIQTNQMNNPQQAAVGGAAEMKGRGGDMPVECVRKLKRMNSNSIKIVDLLTDPTEEHVNDARDKVNKMTEDFAVVEKGVKATVEQQTVEESRKMLLNEMQDLMAYMNQLTTSTAPGHTDTSEARDAAEKIADLTVKMTFAQDPKTKRRSELLNSSKKSFIAGEKMDATIRRASLIAATSTTLAGIDHATQRVIEQYSGPQVDEAHAQQLEKALQDKIGRLNAALALYMTAHSDPNNIDYPAAINSMHTIKELMKDLPADAQILASTKDPAASKELLNDMQTLFDGARKLCSLTEADERDKMQEACNKYANVADKLIFTFTRGRNLDKENEIVELSRAVGNKTSLLLMSANDLMSQASTEPGVEDLDTAGVRSAAAARDLMACAQLTAPAIQEAHCRSAMAAAGEGLTSSLHKLSSAWKPLVADPTRHHLADELHHREMDVHKALEKLNNALSNVNADPDDESLPVQERQRLKYIYSLAGARSGLEALQYNLDKPGATAVDKSAEEAARQRLSQQMAQLNGAVAALSHATRDPKNPDYATLELALGTISQLTPQIVKDMSVVSCSQDEGTRHAMQQNVIDLCEASKMMLANVERMEDLGGSASKFGAASSKLTFLISPGADKGMEKMMAKVSSEIYDNATELVSSVPRDKWIEPKAAAVLAEKANGVHNAAKGLQTVAKVTAPSVNNSRCASALSSAVEELRSASEDLLTACQPHLVPGAWQQQQLEDCHQNLNKNIDYLEQLCQLNEFVEADRLKPQQERRRLQFINSAADAKRRISAAEEQMKLPLACAMMREEDALVLEQQLSDKMTKLNAAIAALAHATHDPNNPDYKTARSAADTISELMPQIIQESRIVCGTKDGATQNLMLNHVKQLCEASKTVCDNAGEAQGLKDAAARYNDASNKLMMCLSPSCGTNKQQEIVDLSAASCVRTSELLSQVQALTQQVGGDVATDLDRRGASTADAAQNLLAVAQVTAPNISSPQCLRSLESAVETLRGSAAELTAASSPHAQPDARQHLADSNKNLNHSLDELLRACREVPSDAVGPISDKQRDKQRLQYITSLSGARNCFDDAHQQLKQPVVCALMKESDGVALQQQLTDRVAQLNAAIAALIGATSDREHPDYTSAQRAVNTITTLTPLIVKDTRVLSGTKDGATQERMLQEVQKLCDASRAMCGDGEQQKDLREAAANFSQASRRLMFTVSPGTGDVKDNQIVDLSAASCVRASELLSQVQALTQQVGGDVAIDLDKRGAKTADAAQNLLAVAQVTAPSISSPQCLRSLESAVETLRGSATELTAACSPHAQPDARQHLSASEKQLNHVLDELLRACRETTSGVPGTLPDKQQEKQRLQYITSLSGARNCFDDAHQQLRQPVVCALMKESDGVALQQQLTDRVAQLNAAIAALIGATSDRDHPDYASAQRAVNTITTLTPLIVKDTRVLSGTKDGATQERMLQEVQKLCDASRAMCVDGEQQKDLREAAANFSLASSGLMFTVSPEVSDVKSNQIVDLSAASCVRASELLSQVQALTQQVGGDVAIDLDKRGAKTADAAQNLLAVAQVTAPSISSPQCLRSLESAVETLRGSATELTAACSPHAQPDARQHLSESQKQLNNVLDELLRACRETASGVPGALPNKQQDKQRLQFITSLSGARNCFDDAHQQLKQPVVCALMKESDGVALQQQLMDRVAQLNAAIAALIGATSDRDHPDYASAQRAVNTITTLTPLIVKDTRVLSGTRDGATQERMLQEVQKLCDASKAICAEGEEPKDLRQAAANFSQASSGLIFTVNPEASDVKGNQIVDLSAASCVRASELLSQVQALTQQVGGDVATDLDRRGAKTAEAAQNLLAVAQVTAPSIGSSQCLKPLESAVETLRGSAANLTAACSPHAQPDARQHLNDSQRQLNRSLDELLKACREPPNVCIPGTPPAVKQEKQRLEFINSLTSAKSCFDDAHTRLEQPVVRELLRQADEAVLEYQLSERMAQLNAAIAGLALAVHDRENPDYVSAQKAVHSITTLMPLLVQDAKSLSSTKDVDTQKTALYQAQQLCDATRAICEQANDPQCLREAAAKFADASSRLNFIISPRTDHGKEKQIVDLSAASCVRASELLSQVQALTQQVGGDVATDLDQRGAKSADAAQALLTVAQVAAARIDSPHCQEALKKAVAMLRGSAAELTAACAPHVTPGAQQQQLQDSHKHLDSSLDQLLQACNDSHIGAGGVPVPEHHEVQRVKFIRSISAVSGQLDDADKKVKEPLVWNPLQSAESAMLQSQLTARLAQLNAAIAALTSATTDHKQPDYTSAERAIITITKLMPTVVQDAKKLSCTKDDNCQRIIQDNLKELCEASRGICANAGDPKKLNEAAAKFAVTSGQLVSLVGANDTPQSTTMSTNQAIKGKGPKPAVPIRSAKPVGHAVPSRNSCSTQDFLDNLRAEESKDKSVRVVGAEVKDCRAQENENKREQEQFSLAIDTAQDEIKYAQGSLKTLKSKQTPTPSIDALELVRKEQHMEEMLGKAGMEVAALVSANYANKLDYKIAKEPLVTLTKAVRVAVEDGSAISSTLHDEARKKFLNDMMGLCDATQNICDASRNNTQKLNDAAIIFSNQSVKLLRAVGANINPALEKEVMTRAKAIGDSASRLAMEASAVASTTSPNSPTNPAPSQAQSICTAGAQCVDAAGKLVYTAKLIAPTIHHSTCQDTLISSADTVSANLATFSETWKPLAGDPNVTKLSEEARNLQKLLENLKADVKGGKLVKRKEMDRMVTLDTPLRELTCHVIENAKLMAEHGELSAEDKQQYVQYSGRLADALRALDLAYARCQRAPHDTNRRCEMFAAIGDLEVLTLQSRPARSGLEMSNIVDFRDFLEGMVTESNKLMKTVDKLQAATGKRLADDVKVMCTKIHEEAPKLLNPTQHVGYDTFDDIMEFDKFAQDCNLLAKELNAKINGIPDQKAKVALRSKLFPVVENLNLLRFATNSALSTALSASYDMALQDLDNFQNNVVKAVVKRAKENKSKGKLLVHMNSHATPAAQVRLLKAARGEPQALCRELTGYATRTCAYAPHSDDFEDHVNILTDTMQKVTQAYSLQAANGIRAGDDHHTIPTLRDTARRMEVMSYGAVPDNNAVELDILIRVVRNTTEAHCPKSAPNKRTVEALEIRDTGKQTQATKQIQIVKDEVTDKLLTCERQKVQGTQSQLQEQFQQLAAKLNIMSSNICLNIKKPELASKSLHITAEVAEKLANTARSLQDHTKPIQSKKIEDASYAMSLATYNLLKTSEFLCQDPDHHNVRRRLMGALHLLNDAINKLERTVHPEPKVSRDCAEHLRSLQLQSAVVQSSPQPVSASPYAHCIDALQSQRDVLLKLNSDQAMSREEFLQSMMFVTTAVGNSTECAAQAAYLLSVSDNDKNLAIEGVVDTAKIQSTIAAIHDSCVSVVMNPEGQGSEEKKIIEKLVDELLKDLDETIQKTKDEDLKKMLKKYKKDVEFSAKALYKSINENMPEDVIRDLTLGLIDDVLYVESVLQEPALVPTAEQMSADTKAQYEDITKHSIALVSKTQDLIKEIKSSPEQSEVMKWSSYTKRREVLAAFDALLKSIKLNGQNAKILEAEPDESEEKSYVQVQAETAFKWLHKPMAKSDIKANGQQAARNLIDVGKKMTKDLSGADKEDMRHLVEETEQLFTQCCKRYDQEQYGLLMERIRELRKAIERIAVTKVVEDFMDAEEPLADLDILADAEKDEKTRKFLLERKIAELLAQLAGVTRAARFIADTGSGGRAMSTKLKTCSEQTELLAPMLVKAAEERINKPDDKAIIENYKALLAQYTESLSKIRELCDQSIDPMEFVQAAGETMQRMREESTKHNDPMKCAYTSTAITKLANRVIHVGLSSSSARNDPELAQALTVAQQQLSAATPSPGLRASRMPDWKDTTAQILRATDEVEQVLGGENIFKNHQPDANQPIYNEALNLHEVTRGWSSRDNEIVAVAKRMAVLMAKLSAYMNSNKQHEVLTTSKAIVAESHEVSRLAKKLAHECSDHRIKTNLLQLCEKIPTISGQLKMLTTVKASSLGHQGTREDQEAMDMLVSNAQSLMISTRDVVNAANSASVKIMSQRGPRIKWVRKTYY